MMKHRLTVIIPSLGRNSIAKVIDDIQKDEPALIIVLAHGHKAFINICNQVNLKSVQVTECSEKLSLSEICNIGLKQVVTNYFAFFSDDDTWITGKTNSLIDALQNNPEFDIAIGSTIEKTGSHNRIRPTNLLENNQNIFDYLPVLFKNNRYIGLQDAMLRNGKYPDFRPNLNVYEDVIWLSDAQQLGHKVICIKKVVSTKFPSMDRSNDRQTTGAVLYLYKEIMKVSKQTATKFFIYHSTRAAIASGDLKTFQLIVKERFKTVGKTLKDVLVLPTQILTLMGFFLTRKIKRKSN
jgi:hypothetical protein